MYIPASFAESDLSSLHDLIEQNSFGLLVSHIDGEPFATHLPFLLERETGPRGCLIGHMARANPHWRQDADQSVLAVFSGPHAYVSPAWYEADQVVPTWNYVAVHVYGRLELVEEHDALLAIVRNTVRHYERTMPQPWSLADSPTFVDRMLAQIVGFRIVIERIEGKLKLSQNQPAERREKVVRALQARGDENSRAIAGLMTPPESQ
jgi:transcriptional regulator